MSSEDFYLERDKRLNWKGYRTVEQGMFFGKGMGFYRKFRGRSRAHLFEIGLNKNERFN